MAAHHIGSYIHALPYNVYMVDVLKSSAGYPYVQYKYMMNMVTDMHSTNTACLSVMRIRRRCQRYHTWNCPRS